MSSNQCCGSALVQCGSGSSFLSPCRSGSGFRETILVRLLSHKKLNFYMKNIGPKTYRRGHKMLSDRQKTSFICKFWSVFMLLDPDPDLHSQYGSGSRTAKSIRSHPDPQHCFKLMILQLSTGVGYQDHQFERNRSFF
jgi:hypothetical protein